MRALIVLSGFLVFSVAAAAGPGTTQRAVEAPPDSAITSAVKSRLAADHLDALCPNLKVQANDQGIVWLTGTATSEELAERVVDTARNATGVNWVRSSIVVDGQVEH